jgi:hypothetical protein
LPHPALRGHDSRDEITAIRPHPHPKLFLIRTVHPFWGAVVLLVAWLIGQITLTLAFDAAEQTLASGGLFAGACAVWWTGYGMFGTRTRAGNAIGWVGLGLWVLSLFGALLTDVQYSLTHVFFWAAVACLALLIAGVGSTPLMRVRAKRTQHPA